MSCICHPKPQASTMHNTFHSLDELGFATRLLTFSPNITTIDFPVPINKKFILETEIEPFMVGLDVATTGLNLVIEPAEATIQLYGQLSSFC